MEGMPRLPMLSADYKYAMAAVDFAPKIKEYIVRYYQEDPEKYDHALKELNNLREQVCRCISDVESCSQLKRYYAQLLMLKNRFPMESGDEAAIAFTWLDKALDMPNPIVFDDVNFELACIMHNIGATHAAVAANETRGSLEGIKFAFNHFQMSSWAFQHLRDKLNASNFSIDFDPSLLTWYTNLMLAQAQECILEKSLIDHRKHTIIAKIAVNIKDVYTQCKAHLENASLSDIVGSSRYKEWTRTCSLKAELYGAIASLYMGQQADEEQKMGERLAWYNVATEQLARAQKAAGKDKRDGIKSALQFANDVIVGKQTNAKKENDFIYHEKVAAEGDLPDIQGVSLVKPIGFDPLDPSISGDDLFATLVPLNVLKSVSLYSEEKAKYMRAVIEQVDSKSKELECYCLSLKLEDINLDQSVDDVRLPDMLLERSAAFNAQPDSFPKLLDTLHRVGYCSTEADHKLEDLQNRLAIVQKCNEIKNDAGFIAIRNELNRLNDAHTRARSSNSELQRAIAAHSENLKLLAMPLAELNKRLPAPVIKPSETPEGAQLKRMLDKMKEMRMQREQLVDQLKKQLHADDLTKRLLAEKDVDSSEVYERELRKHDKQKGLIELNLNAQPNILSALTDANANFAERRREVMELNKCRGEQIVALVTAYDVYEDVRVKAEQGRVFYSTLFEKVRTLDEAVEAMEEAVAEQQQKQKEQEEKEMQAMKAAAEAAKERMRNLPPAVNHFDHELDSDYPPAPITSSRAPRGEGYSRSERPNRPRLGDYLDFYRAKQAGGAAPFPPTAALPPGGGLDMPASMNSAGPSMPYASALPPQGGMPPMVSSPSHPPMPTSNAQPPLSMSSQMSNPAQPYVQPSHGHYDPRAAMHIPNQQPPPTHSYAQPTSAPYDLSAIPASNASPLPHSAHQYAPPPSSQYGVGLPQSPMAASTAPPMMSIPSQQPQPTHHQYAQPPNAHYGHQSGMTSVSSPTHQPIPSQQPTIARASEANPPSQPSLPHPQYQAPITSQYGGQSMTSHMHAQPTMSTLSSLPPSAHQYAQLPPNSNKPAEMAAPMPPAPAVQPMSVANPLPPAQQYPAPANSFVTPSLSSMQPPPTSTHMPNQMPSVGGQFAPQTYEQPRPVVSNANAMHPHGQQQQQFLPATNAQYGQDQQRLGATAIPPVPSVSQPTSTPSVRQPPASSQSPISPWHQRPQEPLNRPPFSPQPPMNQFQSPTPQYQQYQAPPSGAGGAPMGYGPSVPGAYQPPVQQHQQQQYQPPRANIMDMDADAQLPAPLLPNRVEEKKENSNLIGSSNHQHAVISTNATSSQARGQGGAPSVQQATVTQATMPPAQSTVSSLPPATNRVDVVQRSGVVSGGVGVALVARPTGAEQAGAHVGVSPSPSFASVVGSTTALPPSVPVQPTPQTQSTPHPPPSTISSLPQQTETVSQFHSSDVMNNSGVMPSANGTSTPVKTATNGNAVNGSSNGAGHLSLDQLLNPSTFAIGEGDQMKLAKRKMKEQFDKGTNEDGEKPLTPLVANPTDPFSSLDPLWCLNKKAG